VRRLIRSLPLVAALALLGACQTPHQFAAPTASWKTYVGQLQCVTGDRSVIGDVVVRHEAPNQFQLSYSSGPGFPLLKLWTAQDTVRAEGTFARGAWQGSKNAAPERLRIWTVLPEIFAAASPTRQNVQAGGCSADAQFQGGRLARLQVRDAKSGERLVFVFNR
jgi:hypothetical protein